MEKRQLEGGNPGRVQVHAARQREGRYVDPSSHISPGHSRRYLLRIETSNPDLYATLHPGEMSWENRVKCLRELREVRGAGGGGG